MYVIGNRNSTDNIRPNEVSVYFPINKSEAIAKLEENELVADISLLLKGLFYRDGRVKYVYLRNALLQRTVSVLFEVQCFTRVTCYLAAPLPILGNSWGNSVTYALFRDFLTRWSRRACLGEPATFRF